MKKELFNTINEALEGGDVDGWSNAHSERKNKGDYIFYGVKEAYEAYSTRVVIYDDGELRVKGITQVLTRKQRKTLRLFYYHIQEELATRNIQRALNQA